jgi:dipeptidyl-peptidase 4
MRITFLLLTIISTLSAVAQKTQLLPLTLENIWSGTFDQKDIIPQLMHTKPNVAFVRADKTTNFEGILTLDMITGKIIDTLFTNQTKGNEYELPTTFTFFEDFTFAPDDNNILVRSDKQSIYHTSHKEFVFIWNNTKKTLKPLSTDGKVSAAMYSPNSNYVSYVRDANVYIKNIETDKTTIVTTDGVAGSIINGIADEVYEDGFGLHEMCAWNPQSTKIAFIKLNQNYVKRVPIINYERAEAKVQQRVYAKAGESISEASIYVYDIINNSYVKMDVGSNVNQYIVNFKWHADGNSLLIERINRAQTQLDLLQCNATNGSLLKTVLTETQTPFVRVKQNNIRFKEGTDNFLWLSEKDGFNHIYDVNTTTGTSKQITSGNWEVQSIESIDAVNDKIFFMANKEDATQSHLYSITGLGKDRTKLTNGNTWHKVLISNDNKYFFDKYTTLNTPYVYKLYKTNGNEVNNKALIENKRFKETVEKYEVKNAKEFNFTNKNGQVLNGWVINNAKFDKKKQPLLLYVYGSNNKQEVTQQWNDRMAMTFKYFANLGYIVACIDPSGTPGKGVKFRNNSAESIEANAIEDIIDAKKYLINNFNVNANNTALMGWSYGGFLTTMAATKYAGNFNKYVAIAPVTNWKDYAVAYTERILQSPSDNVEKYKLTLPSNYVDNYKGGLLLVHGSYDDNVHLQHTMKLSKALTESDFYYDLQVFTDKGHSLSEGQIDVTRMNLFKKITKFLQRTETD